MRIQRTIPPTAAPIYLGSLLNGVLGAFSGKRYLKSVEAEFREYFDVKHIFLVSSGKAALTLILEALKLKDKRREVIIPAYTCFSVPAAILKAGLKVSLCDIDPETLDFDYDLLKKTINKDTLCVVPSNLFGIPSDLGKINDLCEAYQTFVVEDAAQAMGETYDGKMLGAIGDVGFFSLGRGKNVTCGSGGIIVTNSDDIADVVLKKYSELDYPSLMKEIKDYLLLVFMTIFLRPSLYWLPSAMPFLKLGETIFPKGFPIYKLSGIKAAILSSWKLRLDESNKFRKSTVGYFGQHFNVPEACLRLPFLFKDQDSRESVYLSSRERGLGISKMYPSPINEIEDIKQSFNGEEYPMARSVAARLLTVPTHQLLSQRDKENIFSFLKERSGQIYDKN